MSGFPQLSLGLDWGTDKPLQQPSASETFYALAEPVLGEAEPDLLTLKARIPSGEDREGGGDPLSASHVLEDSREGAIALAPSLVVVQDFHLDRYTRRARRIAIRD